MNTDKSHPKKEKKLPHPPLKPKHPDLRGAPNDNDPHAQYEDKDES